eukprot:CAMPEP_0117662134 /NCGR_PEP_ID=MMETSP0804-20121206/7897_1 /TAXON_ID=1074897 /ORGANISM="Tetraselmis astigmatica, Strain CCMP880" /LENGTH=169 /DNA_ID=CAMNT_0005469025 /DNA_START=656 /DNA_END=1165 /DNA_ORIENTATION=+
MASEAQQEPAAAPLLPPPQAALPFANDGSFMEQFLKMQQQQQEKCSSSTAPVRDSNFIASSSFTGAKEGFVFKSGTKGVGYYKDAPKPLDSNQSASAKKQAAKPVILKSKPIIAVQKRSGSGVDLSANKKKKTEEQEESDSKSFYQKEMERYRSKTCGSDTAHERPLVK